MCSQTSVRANIIAGARVYYMRKILHDYSDDRCLVLLQNTMAAMGPESVIIIDEMIIPNAGTHWRAMHLDMTMMVSLASMERTDRAWRELLDRAGLSIQQSEAYSGDTGESVIVAKLK